MLKPVYITFVLLTSILAAPVSIAAEAGNELLNDPSPYLAMHGNDPVNWRHWDEKAVAQAKKEDKLLFVSIGYFSCHWCHVMQKESYQDGEIANLVNNNFIPVKVDRELDPALDARLIEFVERTRGYSGWPLNVFITPEGYPLLGLVYLPPEDFKGLLVELGSLWKKDASSLKADAKNASVELAPAKTAQLLTEPGIAGKAREAYINAAMQNADSFLGGFGQQGKFPSVPQLMTMLNLQADSPDERLQTFLVTTLDNMMHLGLNDQLAGGFFRYTVDPQWRVPHFEKMLYDNALLASLYFRAGKVLKNPGYTRTAVSTISFMQKELLTRQGALAASLSALDDKGIEGGYYLWDKQQLKKILSAEDYRLAEETWALGGASTTEDGYLPSLFVVPATAEKKQQLEKINKALLAERNKRSLPRDDKLLAAWNGLAISAFVEAHRHDPDAGWLKTAVSIRNYVVNKLWDGERLLRARDEKGNAIGTVTLTDYVAVAEGLLDMAELTGKQGDAELARNMIGKAWDNFVNEYGFRRTSSSLLALPDGEIVMADSPIYSPSSQLLRATLRAFDNKHVLHKLAINMFANGQALMLEDPYWFATQVDVSRQLN